MPKKEKDPEPATIDRSQPAIPMTTEIIVPLSPRDFKPVKRLTRDVTSLTKLGEAIICCQGEIFTISMDDKFQPGTKRDAYAVDVLDCLRGEEFTFILSSVLRSTLARVEGGITGKYFAVRSGEIPAGKRWRKDEVIQLERTE